MRRIRYIGIILLFLFAACSGRKQESKKENQQPTGTSPIPVEAFIASVNKVNNNIQSTGTVMADEEVEVRSEVNGKIEKIHFEEGTEIEKGALLVKIDDKELEAQLQKLKFEKQLLQERESRQKKLLEINAISREEYDASLNQLNVAGADIALLDAQLEKTEIRAPFNGSVGLKFVSNGSTVSPSTLITTLQSISPVKIDFSIPEKYREKVKKGAKVQFSVEGLDKNYTATVYAIDPRIDPGTRTLRIRAIHPNTDKTLLPGAFAKVELLVERNDTSMLLPSQAIIPDIKGQKVFINKKGKAVPVPVEIGLRTGTEVQVISGINAGDTVITTGIMQLKPNMPVNVTQIINQVEQENSKELKK